MLRITRLSGGRRRPAATFTGTPGTRWAGMTPGVDLAMIRCGTVLAALVIPLLTGCQGAPDANHRAAESSDRPDAPWLVSPEPNLSIGQAEGPPDYQLGRITAAVRRGDGGLVVADEVAGVVQWFDRHGLLVARVARRGSGPGEFRQLGRLYGTAGDTLVLWDPTLRRITRFLPDGTLLDVRGLDLAPYVSLAGPPSFVTAATPLANGDVLLHVGSQPPKDLGAAKKAGVKQIPPEGRSRRAALMLRTANGGGEIDTVSALLDRESETVPWPGVGPVQVDPYLFRRILVAASPRTGAVCAGDQSAARVACLDSNGTRPPITWDAPAVPVDPSHHERWRDSLVAVFSRKAPASDAAAVVGSMTMPDTMPPYVALLLDSVERLWIQLPPHPGDRGVSRYVVFDLNGQLLARQRLPFDRLLYADGDGVIGVLVDDDGIEFVRGHALAVAR